MTTKQRKSVVGGRKGVLAKASSRAALKTKFESICPSKWISLGNISREFRNHGQNQSSSSFIDGDDNNFLPNLIEMF